MPKIHPTAIVHASAKLAENVEVGPYVVIGEEVEIGAATKIGPHSIIEHATIGKNCDITGHAFIGTPPQDIKYNQEKTRLILGDNCVIRECVSLNRGTLNDGGNGITRIGSHCFLMAYSHVGHDCLVGDNVVMANCAALGGHARVGNGVVFGGLAGVHQFTRIGDFAMIGGASGVVQDIPPFCMAQGSHAQLIGLNALGLRRGNFGRNALSAIKNAYKTLFLRGLRLELALQELENSSDDNLALKSLIQFLKEPSKRGIARPRLKSTQEESVST